MSLYIVRPKTAVAMQSVSMLDRKLTTSDREKQTQEVANLWSEDPVLRDIQDWLHHTGDAKQVNEPRGTTTLLVEMSHRTADMMRHLLPDVVVLRDRPFDLIKPRRHLAAAQANELTADDLWHLDATNLAPGTGFTGKGVTIAVLDTGVDQSHTELGGKVVGAVTFDPTTRQAIAMSPSQDTDGHGTHIAGLICGSRVGVAPDAQILSGVMIPGGSGRLSDFVTALEWAAGRPEVQIVNMSAGIPGYLSGMEAAVADLLAVGILPVMAIGNEGRNKSRSPGNYADVVSVGATNRKGKVAAFSGGGTIVNDDRQQYTVPDLVAPGEDVYSCVMTGGYEAWSGTSMATPIVSGFAALLLEQDPAITVHDLVETLLGMCQDLRQPPERQGRGLIQWS